MSEFRGPRRRGRSILAVAAIAVAALASNACDTPSSGPGPATVKGTSVTAPTSVAPSTTIAVEIGDALVIDRGQDQQVRTD